MGRLLVGIVAAALLAASAVSRLAGQSQSERAPLAEEVFKNVQVLKGMPVNDFMATMGMFSAALGMSCEDCHMAGDTSWENYAADNPRKQMARAMVTMMAAINKTQFGGRQMVTCFSCHRGTYRPKTTPDLTTLHGSPPLPDPRDIIEQSPIAPKPDEVLEKYLQAVGGLERAAALTSFAARGTSVGYGPDSEESPIEIYARAPNQRTAIVRTTSGTRTTTFDGRNGWVSAPFRPVPVLALAGADLDGLRLDAELAFPARIKQVLARWRVGVPTVIEDREVYLVQGTGAPGLTANLYFDAETGLLVRQVRLVDSPIGRLPTQVDYGDYRDVAGLKMPFRFVVTWLDGRDTIQLTEIRPNVPIEAARFARPGPPGPPVARPGR
ncbi:MAG TPA: photosynthetic reaction center cytochrome c subunit family protein [Vicinamibacterales bacterium]|nr:photosynthetic reaction center cytochrome c subunit family protein [Vicinamibacterales bacterium]